VLRIAAARLLVSVAAAASFAAFLGPWWWQGELLASFRPHLAALALVCAVVCLLLWRPLPALGLVAVAALNVAPVVLAYRGAPAPAQAGAPTLRIAHQNAQGGFGGPVRILEHLQDDPTDVLVVLDPAPDWAVFLRDAAPVLGYELVLPTSGAADDRVLVLSRVPLLDVHVPQQAGLPPSAVEMTATLGQEPVRLLAVHTRNPLTPSRWRLRNDQLHAIARWVEDQQDPTVVLGDLNVVPWSPTFARFEHESGLVSSTLGEGIQVTWPYRTPWTRRLGIPIDQLLHSPELTTVARRVDPTYGSEHGVLVVTLAPSAT